MGIYECRHHSLVSVVVVCCSHTTVVEIDSCNQTWEPGSRLYGAMNVSAMTYQPIQEVMGVVCLPSQTFVIVGGMCKISLKVH